jgi:hypothetical protein
MIIGKMSERYGGYEFVGAISQADRDVFLKCQLAEGKYVILVELDQRLKPKTSFTISDYYPQGESSYFELLPDEVGESFLPSVLKDHAL